MKEFHNKAFRMIIHDDRLKEFIVRKDSELKPADVEESLRLSNEYLPGTKFFVLIEGEEGARVSSEARRLAASHEYSKFTEALALYSGNAMQAIAGNLFLKINRPKVPTKFFDNRESAIKWLRSMMTRSTVSR